MVLTNGGIKCWGANETGQLGNGIHGAPKKPVTVRGISETVTALSAGSTHTCVLTTGGGVKCWGALPVDVNGLPQGVVALSAGYSHTCALTRTGSIHCWGDNHYGQLGDGTTTNQPTPVAVSGLSSGVAAISSGSTHTCALTVSGGVHCWGSNGSGQLGNGADEDQATPVAVSELTSNVKAISAGEMHSCALTVSDNVLCWGANALGQLGDGTGVNQRKPVAVKGLASNVAALSAGWDHTCALLTSGVVQCWGGQSGESVTTVSGLSSVVAISARATYTCALTGDGRVLCWGSNRANQPGDNATPAPVDGLAGSVTAISAGVAHTCAALNNGGVQCWGENAAGQLGNGLPWSAVPVDLVTTVQSYYLPLLFR